MGDEGGDCPACLLSLSLDPHLPEQAGFARPGVVGGYLLDEVIGSGASGVVYRARRAGNGPALALKMLASGPWSGPEDLRRFRFEMESCAGLDHPNLVRILEVGEEAGVPFYVMDLAAGTLADELSKFSGKEQVRDAVCLLVKVARAVQHAHDRGVLHRDLKPANILLRDDGEPQVADFGAGRALNAASGLTMTGAAVGTPAYMAPEQAAGLALTTAADQYGLGAILYHLLTAHPPFAGVGAMDVLRQVMTAEILDPSLRAPWLDKDLAMIVLKSLRREPGRRYSSVGEFADDLDRWLEGRAVVARPMPPLERLARWARRHPLGAGVAITATGSFVVLAAVYVAGAEALKMERDRALHHEKEARAAAMEAARVRDESRLNAYAADLYVGFQALAEGHLGKAREMLAKQVPASGENGGDLRGFEWRVLEERCKGQDVKVWREHSGPVTAVAFHPDSPLLASGGRDGRIVVREWPEGRETLRLPREDAPRDFAEIPFLAGVAARSEELSKLMVAGKSNFDDLRMRSRPSRLGEIHSLAWSADGRWLASGGTGSFVRIWTYPEGDLLAVIPDLMVTNLAFSRDSGTLAVFAHSHEDPHRFDLRIYDTHRFSRLHVISDLRAAQAFFPGSDLVATSPHDGRSVEIRGMKTGKVLRSWSSGGVLRQMSFGGNGDRLYGSLESGFEVLCWELEEGRPTGYVSLRAEEIDRISGLARSSGLAWTGAGQSITWQKDSRKPGQAIQLLGHEDKIHALVSDPSGAWMASGGNDHTVRLWRTEERDEDLQEDVGFPEAPTLPAEAEGKIIAMAPEGYWIGDGKRNGLLMFHPLDPSKPPMAAARPPEKYFKLAVARDGNLVMLAWPRFARILRPGAREWGASFQLTSGTTGPVVFSPDSRFIASGGDDNRITIRETATEREVAVLRGHQATLTDLAFSHDGRTLASSSADKTLRLWHVPTWRQLGTLYSGEILGNLEFSKGDRALRGRRDDGRHLVFRAVGKKS
ncbi:MAG: serine/threonine-protein kinase [Akkermansiaceae bacterium]|jgi:WD40 repeat protein|nr:serine/threonine-protein kinase [Akkermansiaceae bacterium]